MLRRCGLLASLALASALQTPKTAALPGISHGPATISSDRRAPHRVAASFACLLCLSHCLRPRVKQATAEREYKPCPVGREGVRTRYRGETLSTGLWRSRSLSCSYENPIR